MHILRVFNTNVVLARDADGREVVLTGRGLGYQARPGQPVDESKVVRVFVPDDGRNADNFGAMLAAIAPEHVLVVDQALAPVWAELGREPSSTTVLALADHLSFAIKRVQHGIPGVFPLRAEIAHLYPRELHWGEQIVDAVNDQLGLALPRDEAVPVALHLVNASFNSGNLALTYRMTGVFSQVFDIIESEYGRPLERESVNIARFITHLRYFFVRVHSGTQLADDSAALLDAIRASHPQAHRCALRVADVLAMRLEQPITDDETAYLTLHIARLSQPGRLGTTPS
ncbi:MAG TPA: PRD domain-containing protein [Propioniciclava sp.]|jgi:beta-glucoside operon transcriptional antiterminator|uniref:PRD domain-containing protein n=1 Tax=Propioniciclava sp. TaxID=2038686 RepID=UPI002B89C8FC|nr:PRD domain-containing protein [Propioniciclava sp.]HRL50374.1 PRD domain-containing protein [Propioniciclava sp.]HRL80741.1 PRD domain-containing protein [Propioniciclava sp.]